MSNSPCIYCRRILPQSEFNTEHVIPQLLGSFENNFTLNCVCRECNSLFSRDLEWPLGRDSGEALLRLRYGVKPIAEAGQVGQRRLVGKANVPGPWFGAYVRVVPDESQRKTRAEILAQVIFKLGGESAWTWIREDALDSVLGEYVGVKGVEIKIVGPSDESMTELSGRLDRAGISIQNQQTLEQPMADERGEVELHFDYEMDQSIQRAMAKIAFNYLAYLQGARFALRADFDELRRYIQWGDHPGWQPVVPTFQKVLTDENRNWRQTYGHLITLDWNLRNAPLVRFSPFNEITYIVRTCETYSGLWFDGLRSGHLFDIETRSISRLGVGRVNTFDVRMLSRMRA